MPAGILGDAGTRMLSRMFQESFEVTSDLKKRSAFWRNNGTAKPHLRHVCRSGMLLKNYLDGSVRERFISSAPNPESVTSVFRFQREVFDSSLQFRIYQLETGVFVSAPLTEIGLSVQVSEGERRVLSCEGEIVDERLRRRHA